MYTLQLELTADCILLIISSVYPYNHSAVLLCAGCRGRHDDDCKEEVTVQWILPDEWQTCFICSLSVLEPGGWLLVWHILAAVFGARLSTPGSHQGWKGGSDGQGRTDIHQPASSWGIPGGCRFVIGTGIPTPQPIHISIQMAWPSGLDQQAKFAEKTKANQSTKQTEKTFSAVVSVFCCFSSLGWFTRVCGKYKGKLGGQGGAFFRLAQMFYSAVHPRRI